MKVALCVPSGDLIHADFMISLSVLFAECTRREVDVSILNVRTSLIENSRFMLVRQALEEGADKLLFLDSDMTFPADALLKLLAADRPIVGATYVQRRPPHGVLGYGLPGCSGEARYVEMARMPTGCLLVGAEVFRALTQPWFASQWAEETQSFVSEDYWFCDRAREAGFSIWCDLQLSHEIGHIGQETYYWVDDSVGDRPA